MISKAYESETGSNFEILQDGPSPNFKVSNEKINLTESKIFEGKEMLKKEFPEILERLEIDDAKLRKLVIDLYKTGYDPRTAFMYGFLYDSKKKKLIAPHDYSLYKSNPKNSAATLKKKKESDKDLMALQAIAIINNWFRLFFYHFLRNVELKMLLYLYFCPLLQIIYQ